MPYRLATPACSRYYIGVFRIGQVNFSRLEDGARRDRVKALGPLSFPVVFRFFKVCAEQIRAA